MIHSMTRPIFRIACGLLLLWITAGIQAQESLDNLADRLVRMRGEVDEMQNELNIKREEHKNRMAYLTAQYSELEANRDREELRVRQLETELETMRQEVAAAGATSETLTPIILDQVIRIREQIRAGFPFKTGDRITELDELESQLNGGIINAQRAINRLWAFMEDEIRITRENAIYTQSILLDGHQVLVDVAKLGSVMMFFRTKDLDYGMAMETPGGWKFERLQTATEKEMVARLFDSLRKQIRQGYFELPNALPGMGESSS